MKQLIVMIGMIVLGVFIAGYIMSDDEKSVKSTMSNVWEVEIERQNTYP